VAGATVSFLVTDGIRVGWFSPMPMLVIGTAFAVSVAVTALVPFLIARKIAQQPGMGDAWYYAFAGAVTGLFLWLSLVQLPILLGGFAASPLFALHGGETDLLVDLRKTLRPAHFVERPLHNRGSGAVEARNMLRHHGATAKQYCGAASDRDPKRMDVRSQPPCLTAGRALPAGRR
jgi:hypothetical protein